MRRVRWVRRVRSGEPCVREAVNSLCVREAGATMEDERSSMEDGEILENDAQPIGAASPRAAETHVPGVCSRLQHRAACCCV